MINLNLMTKDLCSKRPCFILPLQFGKNLQLNQFGQIIVSQPVDETEEPLPKVRRVQQNVEEPSSAAFPVVEIDPSRVNNESIPNLTTNTPINLNHQSSANHGNNPNHQDDPSVIQNIVPNHLNSATSNLDHHSYPSINPPPNISNPNRNTGNGTLNQTFHPTTLHHSPTRLHQNQLPPNRSHDREQVTSRNKDIVDRLTSPAVSEVEGSQRKDVVFLCLSDSSVRCWIFPVATSLNKIDNRQRIGNFSCTIIALVLGKALLSLSTQCPDDGALSELWHSLVLKCIRLGNEIFDSSTKGAQNLSPYEASSTLQPLSPVTLKPSVFVRLTDANIDGQLGYQISKLLHGKDAAALFKYGERTVLLYTNKDGKIMLIDSHQHGERMGPVIVKGTCSRLTDFLRSVQNTLNLEETSYGELIVFS